MVTASSKRTLISVTISVSNLAESNPWTLGNNKNNKIEVTRFSTYGKYHNYGCLLYTSSYNIN